ncbi:hypothetical protein EDB89DRAFT_2233000 [Lactarius sanguifluus]|nr:hypothetical protein EDB89DRAFT_2233000 [Lactarius sanguifluus]
MYVHALEEFYISQLLPRDACPREAHRPKTLLTQTSTAANCGGRGPWLGRRVRRLSAAGSDAVYTSARNTGGDAASASALLRNSTALHEELAAQMAGQLRRNAEHFSGALVADQGVLRVAEEKWVRTWTC